MKLFYTVVIAVVAQSAVAVAEPGDVLKDCEFCPDLVIVPAGEFRMGTPLGVPVDNETGEQPPVHMTIPNDYALGRTEVTNREFAAFAEDTGFEPTVLCRVWNDKLQRYDDDPNRTWRRPGVPSNPKPDHPVSCVSWQDAKAYVVWLAERSGQLYRLPTEAEWEYAARAGSDGLYPWGNNPHQGCAWVNAYDLDSLERYPLAWTHMACRDGFAGVAPVGSLKPNAFGLYDMLGNVWEFAEDCATKSHIGRPKDGRAWVWQGGCERIIQRGGGWMTSVARIRPGYHGDANATHRFDFGGFRVARDLTPAERGAP
ncbi:MAG: formylglycine-generating enzyme family protein [Rhodospirillaceae bacterium]